MGVGRGRSRHPNFEGAETWAFGVDRYDDDNIRDGYTTTTNTTTTTTTATTTTTTTTTTTNATTTTTTTTTVTTASVVPPMDWGSNDNYDYRR